MIDMAKKTFIPAIMKYTTTLAQSISSLKTVGVEPEVQMEILNQIAVHLKEAQRALKELEALTGAATAVSDVASQANFYHDKVVPAMETLRAPIDAMEMLMDKRDWPMPTYSDLLFEVEGDS